MPSFSRSLEMALHKALSLANERDQEFATLEHLLLALADDKDAAAVMRACNVDLDKLRADLNEYIDTELANLVNVESDEAKPKAAARARSRRTPSISTRRPRPARSIR